MKTSIGNRATQSCCRSRTKRVSKSEQDERKRLIDVQKTLQCNALAMGIQSSELMCPSPSWSLSNIKRCMKHNETQMQRLKWRLAKAKWRLSKAKARHSSEGEGKKDLSRPKSSRTFDDNLHERHSRMFPRKEDSLLPSKEYMLVGNNIVRSTRKHPPRVLKRYSNFKRLEFNGVDGVSIMGELTNSSLLKITYSLQVYTDLDRRSRLIDGGHGLGDALFSFAQYPGCPCVGIELERVLQWCSLYNLREITKVALKHEATPDLSNADEGVLKVVIPPVIEFIHGDMYTTRFHPLLLIRCLST
ncbi:hypothetical protein QTG54_015778 [Skeletonema marinoi]|uniref:DOT1 domain-containing protein n=1 Tax=Skeletonema marinoi TaxID=267567 RepID=A0AAD8XU32_9STRA|nr:hypothetical protein QTG54_015778 [Skeletonema marinoi]